MTTPALALVPVLIDDPAGTGASTATLTDQAISRAARDDYQQWLTTTASAGGCIRPIRLRGTSRDVDTSTGEILRVFDTASVPDGVIYTACGDRRASVCPPCAETYRRDTYHLIRTGLTGGKGTPESVAAHPAVFATLTAPGFGPVHTRPLTPGGKTSRCRPRRKAPLCPHGRRMSCGQRHRDTDACLGKPLCPDCYDYNGTVVWNAHAPELWRRTVITIRRHLDRLARDQQTQVRLSYAKVAEFQARGVVHFHAIFRLDAASPDGELVPPSGITARQLAAVIARAATVTGFATVPHPAMPRGWDITWGTQTDTRVISLAGHGQLTDVAVASYLAKYSVKSTEAVGTLAIRITAGNIRYYGNPRSHQGRLIAAAWQLGRHTHEDFRALRRWAHMLGYRGHFATKSRRYSTTLRAIRQARADYRRRRHLEHAPAGPDASAAVTIVQVPDLTWAGRGWKTSGDALLALSAAARARDHHQTARQETAAVA